MRRLTKVIAAITPWTVRSERKAAVRAATAERQQSDRSRAHAKDIERQIRDLAAENHYAASIIDGILRGHGNRG